MNHPGRIKMAYCDIGLNLFCRQFPDPDKVIREAQIHGITCILTGSDDEENHLVAEYVSSHSGVFGTVGIHPHQADHLTDEALNFIRSAQSLKGIVAVGECGLDYDRMFSKKENQLCCLEHHIEIAEETGKPMFLHERNAFHDLREMFRRHPGLCSRCVVHCFTGNRQQLSDYLDMGFMIGITGWICDDRRAGDLREAVSILPLDRVMIETDAPYLTPKNVPGLSLVNDPTNIRYVAHDLAVYMHVDEEELKDRVLKNTASFFNIPIQDLALEVSAQ